MPPFSQLKRSHTCGQIRLADCDQRIRLNGWVNSYRNLGGLLFLDLRDRYGVTQVVINPESLDPAMLADAQRARHEFVAAVIGTVRKRPEGTINHKLSTGEVEIAVDEFYILAESKTPPFEISDDNNAGELLRLEYRYLDLRRKPLQESLRLRHETALAIRNYLSSVGFYEIETPLLIRSTPEGARDFVVPSRVHHGKFYALPQSPQLLKQILMISGFDKYFQIARCLRDEDLRSDRQLEHTQIDMEMSYVTPDDVFAVVEGMVHHVFKAVLKIEVPTPFPRLTFAQTMDRFGVDKPDLRYGLEIVDLTPLVQDCGFKLFSEAATSGGVVKGIVLKGGASYSRKQIDDLTARAKELGAGGLAYILRTPSEDKSPILKFIGESIKDKLCELSGTQTGDALFIVSDKRLKAEVILGQLRIQLAKENKLIPPGKFAFLWVTHFPLFHFDETTQRWEAMHNIVSHPVEEDLPHIDAGFTSTIPGTDLNHPWRKARALQYDLVANGWEIASGGQRINRRDLQEKVLSILGIDRERADKMFGFLLKALEYGAPPHAGVAPGLDRFVALMIGADSIRDVIAFPKTANATSPMDGSPTVIEQEQLDELGLIVKDN